MAASIATQGTKLNSKKTMFSNQIKESIKQQESEVFVETPRLNQEDLPPMAIREPDVSTGKEIEKENATEGKSIETVENTAHLDVAEKEITKTKPKREVGRPKKGENLKRFNVVLADEMVDDIEMVAGLFYKGNRTAYISALVEKDMEDNKEKYEMLRSITR